MWAQLKPTCAYAAFMAAISGATPMMQDTASVKTLNPLIRALFAVKPSPGGLFTRYQASGKG
jgi:hypothetical protein